MYAIATNERVKLQLQNSSEQNKTQEMGTETGRSPNNVTLTPCGQKVSPHANKLNILEGIGM